MGMKGKLLAIVAGVSIVAGISVTVASGAKQADPGISATEIKIGGTFPLTGFASLYKTIPAAEKAYYDYVNDHGGVNGRKINFTILDDAYDPSKTVPLAQQLVEKEGVFAVVGSLGTAPTLATWGYLNSRKVPQALVATGDSYWGFSYKKYPWTIGWQPDYPGESKLYGKYIAANMPNATITALVSATKVGWNPTATFINNVSANRIFLLGAAAGGANVDGIISSVYTKSSTTQSNLAGVKLAKSIVDQYVPSLAASFARGDGNIIYGMGVAWTFVYALQNAGKNPTRASLMKALHNMNTSKNPFVYPGITIKTSPTDNFPIEQERMVKWAGGASGDWQPFGKLLSGVR